MGAPGANGPSPRDTRTRSSTCRGSKTVTVTVRCNVIVTPFPCFDNNKIKIKLCKHLNSIIITIIVLRECEWNRVIVVLCQSCGQGSQCHDHPKHRFKLAWTPGPMLLQLRWRNHHALGHKGSAMCTCLPKTGLELGGLKAMTLNY